MRRRSHAVSRAAPVARVAHVALVAVVTLMALATSGCGFSNLNFRTDHRLHWTTPKDRALVPVPFTVSWTFPSLQGGSFAIFVDRAPIKPGQTLRAVAGGDKSCKIDPTCPSTDYLNQRRVYTTTLTSLSLSQVLPLTGNRDSVQLHQLTVVVLDRSGHRVGESAWTREFKVRKVSL